MKDEFLQENADKLFQTVQKLHPEIIQKEDSSQTRNIVKRVIYKGGECFLKVGQTKKLENLIAFMENAPETKNFKLPVFILSGDFEFSGVMLTYYLEGAVQGKSLMDSQHFENLDKKIIDIVLEIDSFPDMNLPETLVHRKALNGRNGTKEYQKYQIDLLNYCNDGAEIKFKNMLENAVDIIKSYPEGESLERGTAHEELNFNHIMEDNSGNFWIIDWEKISQANIRFFDFAEYLGRNIVTVDGGIMKSERLLKDFLSRGVDFDRKTLLFAIYHRVIGTLWEQASDTRLKTQVSEKDESGIIDMLESTLGIE